jgi:hypothetical protein
VVIERTPAAEFSQWVCENFLKRGLIQEIRLFPTVLPQRD